MSVSENENFMSRWSRRKQEVALEDEIDKNSDKNENVNKEQAVREKTPEEIREEKLAELNALTDEDMPDVETLGEDSDYAGFMSVNVSESLRKIALQKLFHGKSYNIRDGLDEYDGDYTSFEKLDPSVITADMKHMIDVEAKKLLAKEEEDNLDDVVNSEVDSDVEDMDDELDLASNEEESDAELVSEVDLSRSKPDSDEDLAMAENNEMEFQAQTQEENINT